MHIKSLWKELIFSKNGREADLGTFLDIVRLNYYFKSTSLFFMTISLDFEATFLTRRSECVA
jgi:hypothetical protein